MSQKPLGAQKLAVLIDAENAQASLTPYLLAEIAKYGVASVKRIYGDWTGPQLGGWKDTLLTHSIQPMQQFRYTSGKNATDSAMIIDAMDLLYTGKFDGFCLVSSDSDFTRLAAMYAYMLHNGGMLDLSVEHTDTFNKFCEANISFNNERVPVDNFQARFKPNISKINAQLEESHALVQKHLIIQRDGNRFYIAGCELIL